MKTHYNLLPFVTLILFISTFVSCGAGEEKKFSSKKDSDLAFQKHLKVVSEMIDENSKKNDTLFISSTFTLLKELIDSNKVANYPSLSDAEKLLAKKDSIYRDILERKKELSALEETERISMRKEYETVLRNNYLDKGLDIKVKVSGKKSEKLTLTFSLFSDVWFRKFETNGDFNTWFEMGFKRVVITDGYDYSKEKYIVE